MEGTNGKSGRGREGDGHESGIAEATGEIPRSSLLPKSVLEDPHAGTVLDSNSGDHSDVAVDTPVDEVPWQRLSRFNDEEMKLLMIDAVQNTYEFILELFDEEFGGSLPLRLTELGRTRVMSTGRGSPRRP